MKEYLTTQCLPDDGQVVQCWGHKTYCCVEDMEETPDWHKVKFKFHVSYRCKREMPSDIEDSVLEYYEVHESWSVFQEEPDQPEHVIGVTKWRTSG